MKILLDTHIYLWWLIDAPELPSSARTLIAEADSVIVSVVSIWEAGIKWQAGKLPVSPSDLHESLETNNFQALPVSISHVLEVAKLPPIHKDPFDRMLVAQSIAEPLHLITTDRVLAEYSGLVKLV